MSAKGFRSVTQLVEERVDSLAATLQKHQLSLTEVAARERRKDALARAGLTDEELTTADATLATIRDRRLTGPDMQLLQRVRSSLHEIRPSAALRAFATYDELVRQGITPDDVLALIEGLKASGDSGDDALSERGARTKSRLELAGIKIDEAAAAARVAQLAVADRLTAEDFDRASSLYWQTRGTDLDHLLDFEAAEDVRRRFDAAAGRSVDWDTPSLIRKVIDDLDLVATRLIGNETELYSAVDRLRAEAEFRLAIVLPLAALSILLGLGLHQLWYCTVVLPGILLVDGNRRDRAARDLVVDALLLRRVEAPAIEKFEQSAKDVLPPAAEPASASSGADGATGSS